MRMPRFNDTLLLSFLSICLLMLLAGTAHSKAETSVSKAISAARAAVDRSKMDDAQRQTAIDYLEAARADEKEVGALIERLRELRAESADQPKRMEELQKALAANYEQELLEWSRRLPANADGDTLEQILERERTIVADLRAQIETTGEELAMMLSRPAQTEDEIVLLHRRIEELSAPLMASKDEPAALHEARRLRRGSEQRRLEALLELRLAEQDTATQRQSLNELTLRELRYRLGLHEKREAHLQQRITSRGRRELETLVEQLEKREQELTGSHLILASAAATNRVIGEELMRQNEHLSQDRAALVSNEQARERIAVNLQDSRVRLDMGSANERVGRWLWSERRRLKPSANLQQRLITIRDDLADMRLERVMLNEQQRDLLDIGMVARTLMDAHAEENSERVNGTIKDQLLPLLQKRVELLFLLESLLQRRISALEQSEQALQEQIKISRELQKMLDRRLLWIPGHGIADGEWLHRLPDGVYDLIKPSRYLTVLTLSVQDFQQQPAPWIGSLLLILLLLELRRRAPSRIEALAVDTYQVRKDSYQTTVKVLGWTFLAALPAPAAFALTGELLQDIGSPGRFSHSLGQTCLLMALPVLSVQLLRWISMERGLGHAHFRWTKQRRNALRRWLSIAMIVLPLYFVSSLAFIRKLDLAIDVQARLAIMLSCVLLAWILWRLLDVGRLWVIRGVVSEPSSLRKLLRILLPVSLLTVVPVGTYPVTTRFN